jgi:hypothetical protein
MLNERYSGSCDACERTSSLAEVGSKLMCWRCIELDAAPEIEQQPSGVATVHATCSQGRGE